MGTLYSSTATMYSNCCNVMFIDFYQYKDKQYCVDQ